MPNNIQKHIHKYHLHGIFFYYRIRLQLPFWRIGLRTMARANTAKMGGRQAQGEAPGYGFLQLLML